MAEFTEAQITSIVNDQMTRRFNDYALQVMDFASFSSAVRRWLQNELPRMDAYDAVCDYGKAVHNAGRIVINGYVTDDVVNTPLVALIENIVERRMAQASPETALESVQATVGEAQPAGAVSEHSNVPQAEVTIVMKAWYRSTWLRRPASLGILRRMRERDRFSGEVAEVINQRTGVHRFRNVPSEWLQELARNGSFVHEVRTGGGERENATVTFSSRV